MRILEAFGEVFTAALGTLMIMDLIAGIAMHLWTKIDGGG